MNSMFYNCSSLISLDIPNFNTLKLNDNIDINSIFDNCKNIKYLNLLNYVPKDIFKSISENINLAICINNYSQIESDNSLQNNEMAG